MTKLLSSTARLPIIPQPSPAPNPHHRYLALFLPWLAAERALREALDMIFAEGLPAVFRRHELLAGAVSRAVEIWASGGGLRFSIPDPAQRSRTVTNVVLADGYSADALRAYCSDNCGVVLGVGLGALTGKAFRIAHMGHVNAPMVLGTLSVIEMALAALNIPHGPGGVQAAIRYLADAVPAT